MSRLTIRLKIMFWFSLLTFILLAVFLPVLFGLISKSMYNNEEGILRTAASQAILGCEIENDKLLWNEENRLPANISVMVVGTNGTILYSNEPTNWMTTEPFQAGTVSTKTAQGQSWLVYDESVNNENQVLAHVRVASSLITIEETLKNIKIIMVVGGGIYLAVAVLGSLLIAKKSLKPITAITNTAAAIENGDLSLRITSKRTKDEVGHLSETFNSMLEHLETSFKRERQFTSDASHELRTPVAIIMAYAEALLAKHEIDNEHRDLDELRALDQIHLETKKMNVIISQLLMLARGGEGKYTTEIEDIDLNEIISSVVEQMQEQAAAARINLVYEPTNTLKITADQSLMTQLLINLIENGIKYGKEGGYVRILTEKVSDGTKIVVEDNGIGICCDDLPKIFDRFYRADKSRDRSGTGLGLSIVKWIVDEHHGTISVKSEQDNGTSFIINI